jgi:hypothetical protein
MKNNVWFLMVVILGLALLYGTSDAVDRGWNNYSCWEYRLAFEYPAFLNSIEIVCSRGDSQEHREGIVSEFTKLWPWKDRRHLVSFSVSDDSTMIHCMSVSVHDNPDGYDLWRCATELATFRIDEPTREGHRVEYDTLSIGEATVLHVRSYHRYRGDELKWANIYVMQSQGGNIFSISMNESRMKSTLTEEYADCDAVVNRIISSIPWIK